jgi:hypothetical protein
VRHDGDLAVAVEALLAVPMAHTSAAEEPERSITFAKPSPKLLDGIVAPCVPLKRASTGLSVSPGATPPPRNATALGAVQSPA